MAWSKLPTRSSSDPNSSADINQLQENQILLAGNDDDQPSSDIETLHDRVTINESDISTLQADLSNLKGYTEKLTAHGNSDATLSIDFDDGNVHSFTLNDDCVLSFSNPPLSGVAGSLSLVITKDDNATVRTITWPASVNWGNTGAPDPLDTANQIQVVTFMTLDGGTVWIGFIARED